jgi:2-oxoisovalerate dehydrogenase E1 component alpha subunit
MLRQGWWSEAEDKTLFEDYRSEVLSMLKQVEKRPAPSFEHMISDVYDQPLASLHKQADDLAKHIKKYPEHYPATASRLQAGDQ